MANVQGKEQVFRNPHRISYGTNGTGIYCCRNKSDLLLLLAGGFVMIAAQQFLDTNGLRLSYWSHV
jgi:hypothetical protein